MNYSFDTDIAEKYGVNVAIFLNNIAFWTIKNIGNEDHFHDGYYWTYNTLRAFTVTFKFWTINQVRTVIDKCVNEGLLLKGNYNEKKNDQRLWYALSGKGLKLFNLLPCEKSQIDMGKTTHRSVKNHKSSITDINTDINTEREERPPTLKPISSKFKPSQQHIDYCLKHNIDLHDEREKFVNHYKASGEMKAKWKPLFMNWLKRAVNYEEKKNKETYRDKPMNKGNGSSINNNVRQPISALNSSLCLNDPNHPDYEKRMQEKQYWEKVRQEELKRKGLINTEIENVFYG